MDAVFLIFPVRAFGCGPFAVGGGDFPPERVTYAPNLVGAPGG